MIVNPYAFGAAAATDPSFANVSILLPMNGANNGTSFPDASVNNLTVSRGGASPPITTTSLSKWNGSCAEFHSTDNDLHWAASSLFSYPGDFSIEGWYYFTSANTGANYLFDHATNGLRLIVTQSSGLVQLYQSGMIIDTGSTAWTLNTWFFIQVVRSGSTVTIGRDGSTYATATNSSTLGSATGNGLGNFTLGNYGNSGFGFRNNMQDFRITKGVARSIAVPTAAFPTS